MMKKLPYLLPGLSIAGFLDSLYLTFEHYSNTIPPCSTTILYTDCGKVLNSQFATVFGIPVAAIGTIHYLTLTFFLVLGIVLHNRRSRYIVIIQSTVGFLASFYFVWLQFTVIHAFCMYCLLSALLSTVLALLCQIIFSKDRKWLIISTIKFIYQSILKNIFFLINPEVVHTYLTFFGEKVFSNLVLKKITKFMLFSESPKLEQKVFGISFKHPIGLAAGFDYEARLTQVLAPLGFGFQTVGTITNTPYKGNAFPMLGRLPKSKSLMVNKGFKNPGASKIINKLTHHFFEIPVGISIGRTNTLSLKTQKQSIEDIVNSFQKFEKAKLKHSYYELNISCPNLMGTITFYPVKNLEELLTEIDRLKLTKPVFVKMPIDKSDQETLEMLDVISRHSPAGVIFGNLQKNRGDHTFDPHEVSQFKVGNFSGKPTFERSNELIKLSYKHYGNRFVIIGCGGVFNAKDAYLKITFGATLVQLITGMIFEGPQLIAQINIELEDLLKKDGFTHISQAIGTKS